MGMEAAGAYLQTLREAKQGNGRDGRLSRAEVAGLAQQMTGKSTAESAVWKLESGATEARAPLVAAVLRIVGANAQDYYELVLDEKATKADGIQRAGAWLRRQGGATGDVASQVVDLFAGLDEEQRDAVLAELTRRTESPLLRALKTLFGRGR